MEQIIEKGRKINDYKNEPNGNLIRECYNEIIMYLQKYREKLFLLIDDNIKIDKEEFINHLFTLNKPIEYIYNGNNPQELMTELANYLFEKKFEYILTRESYIKKVYELEVEFFNVLKIYKYPLYYDFEKYENKYYNVNTNLNINIEIKYFQNIFPKLYIDNWENNIKYEEWFYRNLITLKDEKVPKFKGYNMENIFKKLKKEEFYYQLTGFTQYNLLKGNDNNILHVLTNNAEYFLELFPTSEYNHLEFEVPFYFEKIIIIQKEGTPKAIIMINNYPITEIKQDGLKFTNFHGMLLNLSIVNYIFKGKINLLLQDIVKMRIKYLKSNNQSGLEENLWNVFTIDKVNLPHPFKVFKEKEWNNQLENTFFYKPHLNKTI